jgi:hypothetical protein
MRKGRTAHLHDGSQVHHTFFAVTKDPEKSQTAAVSQEAEQLGNGGKILVCRQLL